MQRSSFFKVYGLLAFRVVDLTCGGAPYLCLCCCLQAKDKGGHERLTSAMGAFFRLASLGPEGQSSLGLTTFREACGQIAACAALQTQLLGMYTEKAFRMKSEERLQQMIDLFLGFLYYCFFD